jgi:hypothetical protein
MWAGLLWSRALLSVSMILFLVACVFACPLQTHVQHLRRHPYLLLMPLLFLAPLMSGAWSSDKGEWLRILQIKLPLLLLPLFSMPLTLAGSKTNRELMYWMGISLLVSMSGSVWYYLQHTQEVTTGYLQAKVLPVDIGNDHVRYGWLLVLFFAWGLHLLGTGRAQRGQDRKLLIALLLGIFIFQHLLASKTGLAGMYLVLGLYLIMHRRQARVGRMAWLLLAAPLAAWVLAPTFRNRLRFVRWDFQHYSRGAYTEGLSDAPRVLSIQAGQAIWKDQPLLGCGFGDIRREITEWYTRNTPMLKGYEYLLPSNEFILYGAAGGLLAFSLFFIAVTAPFFMRGLRRSFAWIAFHLIAVAGFLYEIALETQYGVFIYAFLGCWLHAILTREDQAVPAQDLPN